jgi:hypothetical protein
MADQEKILIEVKIEGQDKGKKDIKDITKATTDANKEAKAYNKTMQNSAADVKLFGVSVNSLKAAMSASIGTIKNSILALRSFKVALAATGIGLIVLALGSLVAMFKSSEEGANKLAKIMDVVGVVIGNVTDILADLGSALFDTFGALLKGDFTGALKAAAGGVDQLTNSVKSFNEETRKEIKQAQEVADLRYQTDILERQQLVKRAELESQIAVMRLQARQEDQYSAEERLAFLDRANALSEELLATDLKVAENRLKERQLTNSFSKSTKENLDAEAEAEARVKRIEGARANSRRQIERERIRVQGQIRKENAKTAKEQQELADRTLEAEKIAAQQTLDIKVDLDNRIKGIDQNRHEEKKSLIEAELELEEQKNMAILQGAGNLFGSLAGLIGQNSVFGKAAAIAEATINSFVAGTAALRDTPGGPLIKGLALATVITTGLATVKRILSVQLPQVQPVESSFADGGFIKGPSHARGGVNINAEGGEYIISKDRMRNPYVRSMAMKLNNYKQSKQSRFALGGFVNQDPNMILMQAVRNLEKSRPVLVTNDLDAALTQRSIQVTTSTI